MVSRVDLPPTTQPRLSSHTPTLVLSHLVTWASTPLLSWLISPIQILGLFVFGLGLAPIAVVQESIILANNSSQSKSVGKSIALGLLLGKTSAFAAAYSAEPLAAISPRLPFLVAMSLSFLSFSACAAYAWLDRTLPPLDEDVHEKVHGKSTPELRATKSYGDPFWLYILVCALAGTWYTTIHSSSSFIQAMYNETEARAAGPASVILFSSSIVSRETRRRQPRS